MDITCFQRKISLVARRAGDPVDGTTLSLVVRQASDAIDGNVQRLVKRLAGGSLTKDTFSLPVGHILLLVTCKSVKTSTYTHWYEVTGLEKWKLLRSGSLPERRVSGSRYSAIREP